MSETHPTYTDWHWIDNWAKGQIGWTRKHPDMTLYRSPDTQLWVWILWGDRGNPLIVNHDHPTADDAFKSAEDYIDAASNSGW